MTEPTSTKIAPAVPVLLARCPVTVASARHDGNLIRCVCDDTHGGRCRDIAGNELTADALTPVERYEAMGLPVPARLVASGMRPLPPWVGALRDLRHPRWHDGDATIAVFIVVSLAWIVSMGVLGAKALGWIR